MLDKLINEEKELDIKIHKLNLQHEKTLIKFINNPCRIELLKELDLLDSKIDHLQRLYEAKVETINKLIYN